MFTAFGSQVTVLDGGDRLLPRMDEDVAAAVQASFEERGITVRLGVQVTEVVDSEGGARVRTDGGDHDADAVVVAVGRRPMSDELGLAAAGVEVDDKGFVIVDDQLRTSDPDVFAVGDINGGPQFTYISYDDHRIVWDALQGKGARRRSDRVAVPTTTFITPPLSHVGMNEAEARESGREVLVASAPVAKIA